MRAYMTTADYQTMTGKTVTEDMLKRASLTVDDALMGAVYAVDSQGIPTDSDVLDAVRWAIVWQVDALTRADSRESSASALGGKITSAKIGSASYNVDPSPVWGDLDAVPGELCTRAALTLRTAGLGLAVKSYG